MRIMKILRYDPEVSIARNTIPKGIRMMEAQKMKFMSE